MPEVFWVYKETSKKQLVYWSLKYNKEGTNEVFRG